MQMPIGKNTLGIIGTIHILVFILYWYSIGLTLLEETNIKMWLVLTRGWLEMCI